MGFVYDAVASAAWTAVRPNHSGEGPIRLDGSKRDDGALRANGSGRLPRSRSR